MYTTLFVVCFLFEVGKTCLESRRRWGGRKENRQKWTSKRGCMRKQTSVAVCCFPVSRLRAPELNGTPPPRVIMLLFSLPLGRSLRHSPSFPLSCLSPVRHSASPVLHTPSSTPTTSSSSSSWCKLLRWPSTRWTPRRGRRSRPFASCCASRRRSPQSR